MRNVTLFIGMSLDGYIADQNGNVDWMNGQDQAVEGVDTYSEFVTTVDTVIMGWKTYHQIVTELSPDEWVYDGLMSYVVTHRNQQSTDRIRFTAESPVSLVQKLKLDSGKDIWICGGADIIHQLMQADLIDVYYISVIPTILGGGTRLFHPLEQETTLRLLDVRSDNGITNLIYQRRALSKESAKSTQGGQPL